MSGRLLTPEESEDLIDLYCEELERREFAEREAYWKKLCAELQPRIEKLLAEGKL